MGRQEGRKTARQDDWGRYEQSRRVGRGFQVALKGGIGDFWGLPHLTPEGQVLPPRSKYLIPIETVKTKARTKLGCSSVTDYINLVPILTI